MQPSVLTRSDELPGQVVLTTLIRLKVWWLQSFRISEEHSRDPVMLTFEHCLPRGLHPGHECLVGGDPPVCEVALQVHPGSLHRLEDGGQDDAPVRELGELHGLAVGAVEA